MSDVQWPAGYVPGFTDNFVSNEVIVRGLCAADRLDEHHASLIEGLSHGRVRVLTYMKRPMVRDRKARR